MRHWSIKKHWPCGLINGNRNTFWEVNLSKEIVPFLKGSTIKGKNFLILGFFQKRIVEKGQKEKVTKVPSLDKVVGNLPSPLKMVIMHSPLYKKGKIKGWQNGSKHCGPS